MSKISSKISHRDKIQIYRATLGKLLRGILDGIFIRHNHHTLIGKNVKILNKQHIRLGNWVKLEDYSEIQGLSKNGIILGDRVTIGRNVQIRPSSYYGVGFIGLGLQMGHDSSIGPNSYIGCAGQVTIGDNVMIGPNVTIIAENHNFQELNKTIKSQGVNQQGVILEDNVWVGANVTILDGVRIGKGAIIGATTLVNKNVPANSIYLNKKTILNKERA